MPEKEEKFPEIRRFAEVMDRFFEDTNLDFFGKTSFRTNIYDEGNELVVEAELPGFSRDQINVDIVHQGLRITAEQSSSMKTVNDQTKVVRRERSMGRVERIIPIYVPIYPETTKAKYRNGILEVRIQKKKGANTRLQIEED